MKYLVTIILLVACIGLAVALILIRNQANNEEESNAGTIATFSNQLTTARDQISSLNQVNVVLTNDLAASREASSGLSNQLADAQASAAAEEQRAVKAEQQVTNLTYRVSDLEAQNKEMERRAEALTNQLSALDKQIALTEVALAQSQTNNTFLENELKKQVAERTSLEQKFSDLAVMRAQFHKLKDEALMATRLRWMREGTDPSGPQVKGGQLLTRSSLSRSAATARATPGSLNVEAEAGGAVRVIPASETNSPPQ